MDDFFSSGFFPVNFKMFSEPVIATGWSLCYCVHCQAKPATLSKCLSLLSEIENHVWNLHHKNRACLKNKQKHLKDPISRSDLFIRSSSIFFLYLTSAYYVKTHLWFWNEIWAACLLLTGSLCSNAIHIGQIVQIWKNCLIFIFPFLVTK